MTREEAEKHWHYTEMIMRLSGAATRAGFTSGVLELCHYLYVEAMLHGAKHEREDKR